MASALVLIDIQMGFKSPIWGARNNPDAESQAARLLAAWRNTGAAICHIRHVSTEPGSPLGPDTGGTAFMPEIAPIAGEPIFEKSVNSAFIGTNLETYLRDAQINQLVICGLTTPHCVSTTSRMAANLGFSVTLAHDACAAFAANANATWSQSAARLSPQEIHDSAISQLHGEFVTALSSDAILDALT